MLSFPCVQPGSIRSSLLQGNRSIVSRHIQLNQLQVRGACKVFVVEKGIYFIRCPDLVGFIVAFLGTKSRQEVFIVPILNVVVARIHAVNKSFDGVAIVANDEQDGIEIVANHRTDFLACELETAVPRE